jgi:hypothetical protein
MLKRSPKPKRPSKALPALRFAGVSLSMVGGACAPTSEASANTPPPSQNREIFLVRRKSLTSVWQRIMSSTRKMPDHHRSPKS